MGLNGVIIRRIKMKLTASTSLGLWAFSALAVSAGGWETGKLDTSFMYNEGNYAELSYGNLNYSVSGTTQAGVSHDMAKDQTRMNLSGKFQVGSFDIGLTSFSSGAIQMDGQSAILPQCDVKTKETWAACSVVPSADVNMATKAILARYKINENFRVSFIVNNLLNAEYSSRPGDIQPPRNFIAQLQMKF
jgi:outer membrane receptor protein involved in Fe transport